MAFPRRDDKGSLPKMVGLSFGLHIALALFLSLNPWPTIIKAQPVVYTVALIPPEPEIRKTKPMPAPKEEISKPIERPKPPAEKPIEKPRKDDIVEKIKKPPEKLEKPEEKEPSKHLQEAIEEIRKRAALDEIQKRVARREKVEERRPVAPVNAPLISSSKTPPPSDSIANEYYSMVWAKIKESWTIPENLVKEMVDLETVIVIIIEREGKIKQMWFEKKSGNSPYDQSAMRAIKKAEPLPAVPKELGENDLEVGIRFRPE